MYDYYDYLSDTSKKMTNQTIIRILINLAWALIFYYIYIVNRDVIQPKKNNKQLHMAEDKNQQSEVDLSSFRDEKKNNINCIIFAYFLLNLLGTTYVITKECYEEYDFVELTGKEREAYLLRDGFFLGLSFTI
jgi:hypothetical protein